MKYISLSNILASCLCTLVLFIVVFPATGYAHDPIPLLPKPEPPPPPPCPESGSGKSDCCEGDEGTQGRVDYYLGRETIVKTDLQVNGVYPIKMVRQYDSQTEYDSSLGYGWAFNHDMRLFEYPDDSVVIRFSCGFNSEYVFTGGAYQAQTGQLVAKLTKNFDATFELSYNNGQKDVFDTQGRLIETFDERGNSLVYEYVVGGKKALIGTSPHSVDPASPKIVAYTYQLEYIREKLAGGGLSGNYVYFTYNADSGRLSSIQSNDGRTVTYHHDNNAGLLTKGNLESVDGLEGVVSTYVYDDTNAEGNFFDHHNITSYKDSMNSELVVLQYANDVVIKETIGNTEYTFDWTQYLFHTTVTEKVTDDQGLNPVFATREYKFNHLGYVTYKKDALGDEYKYNLDANGFKQVEEVYEAATPSPVLVKTINRSFSPNGLMLSEAVTLDTNETVTTTYTYDNTREATKEVVSNLYPTKIFKTETIYNHDGNSKPTTVQATRRYKDDGTFLETSYTYNTNGDVLTTTLPDGHVVENEYGPAYNGKYVTRTFHRDNQGNALPDLEESYQYDTRGNRTHITDARTNTTTTTYDDKNRRKTVTNAKGHLTTYVYDVNSNLQEIKRDRSVIGDQLDITKLAYDTKNQLIQLDRTDNVGAFIKRSSIRYDSAGNVIARGDSYGIETTMTYDLDNRLTRITDASGNYIKYSLNALGHRTKTEYFKTGDILVRTAGAVFDDLNRQEQIIGAIYQATTFTYDAMGNRITATDALNRPTTVYTYDTLSRLTNTRDANVKNISYQYNDLDQLRFVTDPIGLITEYQYNELGQLEKLISPDTGTASYTYDLSGNRETQTDARNITVTYGYDGLNRITTKTYPGTSNPLNVSYTYDERANGIGKLTGMVDGQGNTEYDYDVYGNLIEKRRNTNSQVYVTHYNYDNNDRLDTLTYHSGRTVAYGRNTLGQVTTVTTTPSGGSAQTIATNITYLPFGAMEDMVWGNSLSLDQTYDTDYRLTDQILASIYNRTYDYDLVNNIKTITDNTPAAKNQSFNYDALDRLDDATGTGTYGVLNYDYDDVGNRTTLAVDANPVINYDYSLTANNRLDNIDGVSIGYDANGNTTSKDNKTYTYDDMNRMSQAVVGARTSNYTYNGHGERIKKSGTTTTLYHYDESGNLLYESDGANAVQTEYIWLGNQRLAMVQGSDLYYSHTDHLGTVQLLTDTNGAVAWSGDYKPFGEVAINPASTITNNLRFPGQYYDAEINLHYNYFRDYDSNIGRYTQSDPIGLTGGSNTYIYALNNPGRYKDSFGLYIDFICDAILEGQKKSYQDSRNKIENDFQSNRDGASRTFQQAKNDCLSAFKYCESKNLSKSECDDKLSCQKGYDDCIKGANDFFDSTIDQLLSAYQMQLTNLNNMYPHLGPGNTTECPPITPKIPRR